MPPYFYNSKVWKDVFSMYTGKTLAPDVVYIMAFVDFMSNMCFPVVVRLYIGRKKWLVNHMLFLQKSRIS